LSVVGSLEVMSIPGHVRRVSTLAAVGLLVVVAGCSSTPAATPASAPTTAASGSSALQTVDLAVAPGLAASPLDEPRTVQAPVGWTVSVFARLDAARLLAWTPDGRLLVSRPKAGEVDVLTPAAGGGTAVPATTTLLSGLDQPHGLAFHDGRLYVAQSDRVDAYAYADGRATNPRTVVDGLPDAKSPDLRGAYAHALKSVAVGQDGAVYVSVGSTANVSPEDRDADPQRATILRVPPGGGKAEVFARGVRNGTGLAVAPDGAVWTAVNNRDNIEYPYDRDLDGDGRSDLGQVLPAYVGDHPLEPFAKLTQGRDLGWPYCNPDPDVDPGVPGTALDYSDRPFVRDVQTNADGSKLDCSKLAPVEQGMGAHSAPLGLSFTSGAGLPAPYGAGALVGIHGSWNRTPPRAPEVSFFSYANGRMGDQQTLLSGFQSSGGDRWGRPVAAVQGPDGAVYVSDDVAGAVYRMQPPA
jgi:glucose/arabinose dehydrogenase